MGFLTQNYRSYPRVTYKNSQSQASELVPAIIETGVQVMRHFFPLLTVSLSINPKDKSLKGTVAHKTTVEYPSSLNYNGKVSFLVDGKISAITAQATKGSFELTETDKKFPNAKKITAYIELADIMVKSDEFDFSASPIYNKFDLGLGLPLTTKTTNLVTNEVTFNKTAYLDHFSFSGSVKLNNNLYTGTWSLPTDQNGRKSEGSAKITLNGEKSATIEFSQKFTHTNGNYHQYYFVSKAIPSVGGSTFQSDAAFAYTSTFTYTQKRDNQKIEYTLVQRDANNQLGGIYINMYIE